MADNLISLLIRGVRYSFKITIYCTGPLSAIITENKIKCGKKRYGFSSVGQVLKHYRRISQSI